MEMNCYLIQQFISIFALKMTKKLTQLRLIQAYIAHIYCTLSEHSCQRWAIESDD